MSKSSMLQISDQFDHFQLGKYSKRRYERYLSRLRFTHGQEVVLKIPDRMSIGDPAQFERFQRELEVMRTLSHPAIQQGLASGTIIIRLILLPG